MNIAIEKKSTRLFRRESGMALLVVLIIFLVVTSSCTSFIWLMNQQQSHAGTRFRSSAAMSAAEAGVYRAVSIFEATTPDGQAPGRTWRPTAFTESLSGGSGARQFTISADHEPDGAIVVTSVGEAFGVVRRLRARVCLASPCLLAGVCGAGAIYLDRSPAAMIILPYSKRGLPWTHILTGRGILFAEPNVSINDPSTVFRPWPGPIDAPGSDANAAVIPPGPARLLLGRDADLMLGPERVKVDLQQLRAGGVHVDGVVVRTENMPEQPEVDREYYQDLAGNNNVNDHLNRAAGEYFGDRDLARKRDSLYSQAEFEKVQGYLREKRSPGPLYGVTYIKGSGLSLYDGQQLHIVGGTLVAEGSIYLGPATLLEITHSAATRTLPGLIILDRGALTVTRQAALKVHGLIYVTKTVYLGPGGRTDVVGSVLAKDPDISLRSLGASTVIRYDPAVLGTPGLRVNLMAPAVAWIASWEELP